MTLSDEQRKTILALRLKSAEQALADASTLLASGSVCGAMNRCYYAIFYAAYALAIRDGRTFRKHVGIIAFFHKEYLKTNRLPRDLGRIFQKAFDDRCEADYFDAARFSLDDATESLEDARRFVAELRSFLATT